MRKDRRSDERRWFHLHGVVRDLDDRHDLKCVVSNVSANGCRIVLYSDRKIPETIKLTPEGFDTPIRGRVIWTHGRSAGVLFETNSNRWDDDAREAFFACPIQDTLDDLFPDPASAAEDDTALVRPCEKDAEGNAVYRPRGRPSGAERLTFIRRLKRIVKGQ